MDTETASVRYMIDDVPAAIAFYTEHLGVTLETAATPALASVVRGPLRWLRSGAAIGWPARSRASSTPVPGGWTRILVLVDDIESEMARLSEAGLTFRNDIVKGVGGSQALLDDPSGNPVELFQPG